jgi:hypothetical protein
MPTPESTTISPFLAQPLSAVTAAAEQRTVAVRRRAFIVRFLEDVGLP